MSYGNPIHRRHAMSEKRHFLYRIQATRPAMLREGLTPEEAATMAQHFAYLERLTEAGTVILFGRTLNTDETAFGLAIFSAASEAEARALVDQDPAVANGI